MQRAVLRSPVVRLSVRLSIRLSVTLLDCDHIGWKSWKLIITRTISHTFSLCSQKAIHLFPGEHGKILGRLKVGREKVVLWRTKAAISLKLIEETLLWTVYRNSPTLFQTVLSPTLYGLPFLEIGGLQLSYPLLSQEQVKLQTSNLAGTFTGPIRIKAHYKFWR